MRLWTLFCACLFFIAPSVVLAQSRFSDDTLRAWEADANGRSCETQTFGFLGIPRATFAYPERALTDRVSGDVLLIFDTQYTDGVLSVVNPRVFASEPEGSFDGVARELASQFQFPAAMRDCEGLRAWLRFRVNNANAAGEMRGFVAGAEATHALTERRITEYCAPLGEVLNSDEFRQALTGFYPQRALERGHEGVAVVQLTIIADGTIAEAVVLDELPEGWNFGAAALQALQVVRFPPRAAACENAALSLRFVLR